MDHSIDRLAVVCKIMLDERVCILRNETEKLKLELFWKDHGVDALNRAMAYANDGSFDVCTCFACIRFRLDWSDDCFTEDKVVAIKQSSPPPISACEFKTRFEQVIAKHGMSVAYITDADRFHSGQFKQERDCHLILNASDFRCYGFGHKLNKISNINDPELVKLANLVKELNDPAAFF